MKESDIRPEDIYKRYLELSKKDAEKCFGESSRTDIPCVACDSAIKEFAFEKNGFSYYLCQKCGSLFQTPRPSITDYEKFYRDSESSRYWAEKFFPATASLRQESIFRPRAEKLNEITNEKGFEVCRVIDVGAGFGMFLEEWRKVSPGSELVAVEPSKNLAAICASKGIRTIENIVEEVEGFDCSADMVVCFEVLEHAVEPLSFVSSLSRLVRPGGLIVVSTLSIDGFDLQVLWEKSKQIFPPHHINFMSIEGFNWLFERAGLVNIEIMTPGRLDVDIVINAYRENPAILEDNRFLKRLVANRRAAQELQKLLAENCLSSHAWILATKPE